MLPDYLQDHRLGDIKLLAVDMDKTLLTDDRGFPKGLVERLDALYEASVVFCPASGRPAPKLQEMFSGHAHKLAFCSDNGACALWHDEYVFRDLLDHDLYREVLNFAAQRGNCACVLCAFNHVYMLKRDREYAGEVGVYYEDIIFVDSFDEVDADANKISLFFPEWDAEPAYADVYGPTFGDRLYITNAGREWIDFMNLGVDKGSGVAHLCAQLGIDEADAAAVGDTYNDIPMLERVGHSYIVANAESHMEEHASWRVPSNNDAGVLALIDAILAAKKASA